MLIVAVFVAFSVQLYVAIEMLWAAIIRKLPSSIRAFHHLLELIFRTSLVVVTCKLYTFMQYLLTVNTMGYFLVGVSIAVPNLEQIIPLVGVTVGIILAFVLQPFIEIVTFWETWASTYSKSKWKIGARVTKDCILILFGTIGMISGLGSSIQNLTVNKPQ